LPSSLDYFRLSIHGIKLCLEALFIERIVLSKLDKRFIECFKHFG